MFDAICRKRDILVKKETFDTIPNTTIVHAGPANIGLLTHPSAMFRPCFSHAEELRLKVNSSMFRSLQRTCRRWNFRDSSYFVKINTHQKNIYRPSLAQKYVIVRGTIVNRTKYC